MGFLCGAHVTETIWVPDNVTWFNPIPTLPTYVPYGAHSKGHMGLPCYWSNMGPRYCYQSPPPMPTLPNYIPCGAHRGAPHGNVSFLWTQRKRLTVWSGNIFLQFWKNLVLAQTTLGGLNCYIRAQLLLSLPNVNTLNLSIFIGEHVKGAL